MDTNTNIAARVIAKFGGIRPMARLIKRPPSTVQSWEISGFIPARQQSHILQVAAASGIGVTPSDFFDVSPAAAE
jgi:hypothetical protein